MFTQLQFMDLYFKKVIFSFTGAPMFSLSDLLQRHTDGRVLCGDTATTRAR